MPFFNWEVFHGDDVIFDVVKDSVVVMIAEFVHDLVHNGRDRDGVGLGFLGDG
jgi:hypothetical protein